MVGGLRGTALVEDLRRLLGVARSVAPRRVTTQVLLLAVSGVIGGAGLLMLVPIVNSLAAPEGSAAITLPILGGISLADIPLPVLLAAVILLTAGQALIQRASMLNASVLNEAVSTHLRTAAFNAVLGAQWSFLLTRRRTDIISAVANGAARSGAALDQALSGAVTLVTAVVTAAVALFIQPVLAGFAIVGTLVLGAVLSRSIRPAYRIGEQYSEQYKDLQAVMTDSLDSLRLIRAHDAAGAWRADLATAFVATRDVEVTMVRHAANLTAASQVGLVTAAASLVLVASWLAVPAATIVVVLLLIARLARSVQSLAATAQRMASLLPGVREIDSLTREALLAAEIPGEQGPGAGAGHTDAQWREPERPPGPTTGDPAPLVALRQVSFRYGRGDGGVQDLTFDVPTGVMTALTGASGAGKSTTADLVLGLMQPDSGALLVDGVPLTRGTLRAWRSRVAYVPQETVLVPGTLRRNLQWSVGRQVDDPACWEALDRAAAAFARKLPDGLDTQLGDRGVRLSGGERQRVAIARALLREPDLLVLDEATSSLDDATEAAVLSLLDTLTPTVTVLVIAHRRSTIDAAGHVVELASGCVVSDWSRPGQA